MEDSEEESKLLSKRNQRMSPSITPKRRRGKVKDLENSKVKDLEKIKEVVNEQDSGFELSNQLLKSISETAIDSNTRIDISTAIDEGKSDSIMVEPMSFIEKDIRPLPLKETSDLETKKIEVNTIEEKDTETLNIPMDDNMKELAPFLDMYKNNTNLICLAQILSRIKSSENTFNTEEFQRLFKGLGGENVEDVSKEEEDISNNKKKAGKVTKKVAKHDLVNKIMNKNNTGSPALPHNSAKKNKSDEYKKKEKPSKEKKHKIITVENHLTINGAINTEEEHKKNLEITAINSVTTKEENKEPAEEITRNDQGHPRTRSEYRTRNKSKILEEEKTQEDPNPQRDVKGQNIESFAEEHNYKCNFTSEMMCQNVDCTLSEFQNKDEIDSVKSVMECDEDILLLKDDVLLDVENIYRGELNPFSKNKFDGDLLDFNESQKIDEVVKKFSKHNYHEDLISTLDEELQKLTSEASCLSDAPCNDLMLTCKRNEKENSKNVLNKSITGHKNKKSRILMQIRKEKQTRREEYTSKLKGKNDFTGNALVVLELVEMPDHTTINRTITNILDTKDTEDSGIIESQTPSVTFVPQIELSPICSPLSSPAQYSSISSRNSEPAPQTIKCIFPDFDTEEYSQDMCDWDKTRICSLPPSPSDSNEHDIVIKDEFIDGENLHGMFCPNDGMTFEKYLQQEGQKGADDELKISPKLLVEELKKKVHMLEKLSAGPPLDAFVEKFMKTICLDYFLQGVCSLRKKCPKKHSLPKDWCYMSHSQAWSVITFIMKKSSQPPIEFCCTVFSWLGTIKSKTKIMMIAKTLFRLRDSQNCKIAWQAVVKALMKCKLAKWASISCILLFCHDPSCLAVTCNLMRYLELGKATFPNYWKAFEPLVGDDFILPLDVLEHILEEVCETQNVDRMSMKKIAEQLKKIDSAQILTLEPLVRKFLLLLSKSEPAQETLVRTHLHEIKKRLSRKPKENVENNFKRKSSLPEELPLCHKPKRIKDSLVNNNETAHGSQTLVTQTENEVTHVYEAEKMKAAVSRAFCAKNYTSIANILISCSKKPYSTVIALELFNVMKTRNPYSSIKNILYNLQKNNSGNLGRALIGRICLTFMIYYVKNYDWKAAYDFLLLIRENHMNPITVKPLACNYSELRVAVVCSEVNFYNKHYNSAVSVLMNNNLLIEDNTKWHLKANIEEFKIVKQMVHFLLTQFNDEKHLDVGIILFKSTMNAQQNLHEPIALIEYFEPFLNKMFEKLDKYKDYALKFYHSVKELDNYMQLSGLTYRVLIILAARTGIRDTLKELIFKAIGSCVYPILEEKENAIILPTCFLEEEIAFYLLEWLEWFGNQLSSLSCSTTGHHLQIHLKQTDIRDYVDCDNTPIPTLLTTVESTIPAMLKRLQMVISEIFEVPFSASNVKIKKNSLFLSPETSHLLLKTLQNKINISLNIKNKVKNKCIVSLSMSL